MKSIKLLSLIVATVATTSCAAIFELAHNPKNILYVSTAGNDATGWPGVTNRPYATIGGALAVAMPGDKILVAPGTYAGDAGKTLTLPDMVTLAGSGTNQTFTDITELRLGHSNEVSGLSFTNRAGLLGLGQIHPTSASGQCYLHDLRVLSGPQCLSLNSVDGAGGPSSGWNVVSNCFFDTQAWGLDLAGTNFFYNCTVQKKTDLPFITQGSRLLATHSGSQSVTYWVGGNITSTTNCAADPTTNNVAIWNGGVSGSLYFLQSSTVSAPATSLQMYGVAGNTNYYNSSTFVWTVNATNAAAVIVPASTNVAPTRMSNMAHVWRGSWTARLNTNGLFLLSPPVQN